MSIIGITVCQDVTLQIDTILWYFKFYPEMVIWSNDWKIENLKPKQYSIWLVLATSFVTLAPLRNRYQNILPYKIFV